jgi:hypothetical protein
MSKTLIGKPMRPAIQSDFIKWYHAYRDEWCKSEREYPDQLVASDAFQAGVEAGRTWEKELNSVVKGL